MRESLRFCRIRDLMGARGESRNAKIPAFLQGPGFDGRAARPKSLSNALENPHFWPEF
jgi:hypothetical protein